MRIEPPVSTPKSLDEAFTLLAQGDGWQPIAGGTDLMVQITGELASPPERVLDLWRLEELRGIAVERDELVLGALTTYTDIRRSPIVAENLPALGEAAATIGAAQIQNRGTLGGNIVNASPAGDTLPILLATDARIVLGSARGEREVSATDFWTAYRRTVRESSELVVRVRIPLPPGREVRFRKVGTRRAQAISKVVMALAWRAERSSPSLDAAVEWRDVRLALGSVADRPIRARETEAVLEGASLTPQLADRAAMTLMDEIHPIDDVRSTAEYRRAVAGNVLRRLLRDETVW
jgi:CO/xanthine dehydrogenase FAD-binding subunit